MKGTFGSANSLIDETARSSPSSYSSFPSTSSNMAKRLVPNENEAFSSQQQYYSQSLPSQFRVEFGPTVSSLSRFQQYQDTRRCGFYSVKEDVRKRPKIVHNDQPYKGWTREVVMDDIGNLSVQFLAPPDFNKAREVIKSPRELNQFLLKHSSSSSQRSTILAMSFEFCDLYCICHRSDQGDYFNCDFGKGGCNGWFHSECTGIPQSALKKLVPGRNTPLVCPLCTSFLEENLDEDYQYCVESANNERLTYRLKMGGYYYITKGPLSNYTKNSSPIQTIVINLIPKALGMDPPYYRIVGGMEFEQSRFPHKYWGFSHLKIKEKADRGVVDVQSHLSSGDLVASCSNCGTLGPYVDQQSSRCGLHLVPRKGAHGISNFCGQFIINPHRSTSSSSSSSQIKSHSIDPTPRNNGNMSFSGQKSRRVVKKVSKKAGVVPSLETDWASNTSTWSKVLSFDHKYDSFLEPQVIQRGILQSRLLNIQRLTESRLKEQRNLFLKSSNESHIPPSEGLNANSILSGDTNRLSTNKASKRAHDGNSASPSNRNGKSNTKASAVTALEDPFQSASSDYSTTPSLSIDDNNKEIEISPSKTSSGTNDSLINVDDNVIVNQSEAQPHNQPVMDDGDVSGTLDKEVKTEEEEKLSSLVRDNDNENSEQMHSEDTHQHFEFSSIEEKVPATSEDKHEVSNEKGEEETRNDEKQNRNSKLRISIKGTKNELKEDDGLLDENLKSESVESEDCRLEMIENHKKESSKSKITQTRTATRTSTRNAESLSQEVTTTSKPHDNVAVKKTGDHVQHTAKHGKLSSNKPTTAKKTVDERQLERSQDTLPEGYVHYPQPLADNGFLKRKSRAISRSKPHEYFLKRRLVEREALKLSAHMNGDREVSGSSSSIFIHVPLEDGGLRTCGANFLPDSPDSLNMFLQEKSVCAYCIEPLEVDDDVTEVELGVVMYKVHKCCGNFLAVNALRKFVSSGTHSDYVNVGEVYGYNNLDWTNVCHLCRKSGGVLQSSSIACTSKPMEMLTVEDAKEEKRSSSKSVLIHPLCLLSVVQSQQLIPKEKPAIVGSLPDFFSVFSERMGCGICALCGSQEGHMFSCSSSICSVKVHFMCAIKAKWTSSCINFTTDSAQKPIESFMCPMHANCFS